jgi:hypothetical protein
MNTTDIVIPIDDILEVTCHKTCINPVVTYQPGYVKYIIKKFLGIFPYKVREYHENPHYSVNAYVNFNDLYIQNDNVSVEDILQYTNDCNIKSYIGDNGKTVYCYPYIKIVRKSDKNNPIYFYGQTDDFIKKQYDRLQKRIMYSDVKFINLKLNKDFQNFTK